MLTCRNIDAPGAFTNLATVLPQSSDERHAALGPQQGRPPAKAEDLQSEPRKPRALAGEPPGAGPSRWQLELVDNTNRSSNPTSESLPDPRLPHIKKRSMR